MKAMWPARFAILNHKHAKGVAGPVNLTSPATPFYSFRFSPENSNPYCSKPNTSNAFLFDCESIACDACVRILSFT